jgi:hypothetical protein
VLTFEKPARTNRTREETPMRASAGHAPFLTDE